MDDTIKQLNILIIDDELSLQKMMARKLSAMGHICVCSGTWAEALAQLNNTRFDLVFLDIYLPDGSGIEFLPIIRKQDLAPLVVMITGAIDQELVEKALIKGAWDYLQKPFSLSFLNHLIGRAAEVLAQLPIKMPDRGGVDAIVGYSKSVTEAIDNMFLAARTDVNVLLTGPSGTGKDLFANELHRHSRRAAKSFVVVDCAVLPETLIESILFGHAKGAFTGADADRTGLIAQANGGTLFLDEIGELPITAQKNLLRVLQEHVIRPLGHKHHVDVDFRLVCATNRDLEAMVASGKFRTDLFHRLNAFPIHLPPLHERNEDIPVLAQFFIERICLRNKCPVRKCHVTFLNEIQLYHWPGNARELKNVLEKIILTTLEPVLYPDHLPRNIRTYVIQKKMRKNHSPAFKDFSILSRNINEQNSNVFSNPVTVSAKKTRPPTLKTVRDQSVVLAENQYLNNLVQYTGRNITEAIQLSGVGKSQFYRLLKKHHIAWK